MTTNNFKTIFVKQIKQLENYYDILEFINLRGEFELINNHISVVPVISLGSNVLKDLQQEPAFLNKYNHYAGLLIINKQEVQDSPIYDYLSEIKFKIGLKNLACYEDYQKPLPSMDSPLTYYMNIINMLEKIETLTLSFNAYLNFSSSGHILVSEGFDKLPKIYENAQKISRLKVNPEFNILNINNNPSDIYFNPIKDQIILGSDTELDVNLSGKYTKTIDLTPLHKISRYRLTSKEFMYEIRNQYYY